MKGKITIEADEGNCIKVIGDMVYKSKEKILLLDALLTALSLTPMEQLLLVSLILDGKIGRKDAPGKTVVSANEEMIKKILKEKRKQESEGD